jgi:predicted AlkP superfamily pyrophosphatase or phosphodiesterase
VHPARHSVLFNGVLQRPGPGKPVRVEPASDQSALVAVPTLFDHLHRAGYVTAGINWPCTRNSTSVDDNFPDVPDQVTYTSRQLRDELIRAKALEGTNDAVFRNLSAPTKDQIWTAAAVQALKGREPSFMAFHLLITDSTQHKYGPQSPAAYTALALADAHLAELLRALDAARLRERTTIIVTADHGFETALKIVNPNVAFRKAGLLTAVKAPSPIQTARAQIVSEGGIAMVYFTNPETLRADKAKVIELMKSQEGVAEILAPDQFAALGLPDPAKNRQMAELILVASEGYAFNNDALGDEVVTEVTLAIGNQGHHGFLSRVPKMNAGFVAWGRGIKEGTRLGIIDNVDVAPTIAALLGQKLPNTDGKVLRELLIEEVSK